MPTLAFHLAITLIFITILLKKEESKYALMLLPFGLVTDLDCFLGVHRATLHNLVVIIIPLVFYLLFRNREGSKYLPMASALIALHIISDGFTTGVFLLYPFSHMSYDFNLWLGLDMEGVRFILDYATVGEVGEVVYETTPSSEVPMVPVIRSGTEFIVLLMSVLLFFSKFDWRSMSKWFSR
ncbi:MAG: hypothetical protein R6U44_02185 [Archaeoglobaceae archaeon]